MKVLNNHLELQNWSIHFYDRIHLKELRISIENVENFHEVES
jgi:hypothetical protein